MSPRPDVSEKRKSQIIEAATTVFAKSGFGKTRMEDIAEESGLSKGALYLYFKSKEDLFRGILDNFFHREFKAIIQLAGDERKTSREKMMMISEVIILDLEKMKFAMPIFFEFWSMSFRKKAVRKIFQQYMENYVDLVVPIVQDGIDRGKFRHGDAYDISMAFGSLIEGSLVVWSYDPENVDLRTLVNKNSKIFLDGIQN
ncbi:MAG: TetR/AcrR family transcriptional regulator [Chloroflexota bacterium]